MNKEIEIHYCPTKEMLGNFFTKPLQGAYRVQCSSSFETASLGYRRKTTANIRRTIKRPRRTRSPILLALARK